MDLGNNHLSSINFAKDVTILEELQLNENVFVQLNSSNINDMSKLKTLNLAVNLLESIESLTCTMKELEILDVGHNRLKTIGNCLKYNPKLKRLRLYNNNIASILKGVFSNLARLELLNLEWNKISRIELGAFDDLISLEELDLRNNKIINLEAGLFDNLGNLKRLYIATNEIQNLEQELFRNLTKVTDFRFDDNPISKLKAGTFKGLRSITDLNLTPLQYLYTIEENTFLGLQSLHYLSLGDNNISKINTPKAYTSLFVEYSSS